MITTNDGVIVKIIPDYPEYAISRCGKIWILPRVDSRGRRSGGRYLHPWKNNHGYDTVELGRYPDRKRFYVHRLVLSIFSGLSPEDKECRHLDGNPSNNCFNNLEWGTRSENISDAREHGTFSLPPTRLGELNNLSKLTAEDVKIIFHAYHDGKCNLIELADEFGCTKANISCIIHKKTWKHLWS